MTIAEILREAKRLILKGEYDYCCNAIAMANRLEHRRITENYLAASIFNDIFLRNGRSSWWEKLPTAETQLLRVEALELAALSAEREAHYKEQENG